MTLHWWCHLVKIMVEERWGDLTLALVRNRT